MGAAAAIIVRKEREIVDLYRGAGATQPGAARRPEELGVHHRLVFDRLVRRAVLRPAGDDRYYLDEPSWLALRGMRLRLLGILLILVLIGVAVLISMGLIPVGMGLLRPK